MKTPQDIFDAFRREKASLQRLLEALDKKYGAKPAKKPSKRARKGRQMSRADTCRMLEAGAALAVVDSVLEAKAWRAPEILESFLIISRETELRAPTAEAANVMRPLYAQKFDELLARYAVKEARDSKTESARPWDEAEIRHGLALKAQLQQAGLKTFGQGKTQSDAAQEIEDTERAELAVVERFLASHHLSSREEFLHSVKIIRYEAGPFLTAHDKEIYEKGRLDALDRLVQELADAYL